jgi:hypothetical protein
MIPLVSSALGAGLNYWLVRAWGERAKAHFRGRYLLARQQSGRQISIPTTTRMLEPQIVEHGVVQKEE